MKRHSIIPGLLVFSILLLLASSSQAQHRHYGGYRHFGPVYRSYSRPVFYGHAFYPRPYFHSYYRPYYRYIGPPIGLSVGFLPRGFITISTGFGPFYYFGGTFYQPVERSNRRSYKVVDPPVGAMVPNLPEGARSVDIDGDTYYEFNGTYYQEVMTNNGRRYKVTDKKAPATENRDDRNDQEFSDDNQNRKDLPPSPTEETPAITTLPKGSRSVEINGQEYYVTPDGIYYEQVKNGFRVVGKTSAGN